MWMNYFQGLDAQGFIFGVPSKYELIDGKIFRYNYHNSFLALHAKIGIFSLPFLICLIWSAFVLLKHNKLFLVLLASASMRWFVDEGMFFESFDFIFYFFIFYAIYVVGTVKSDKGSQKFA
jgi:hypothetical protein